MLEIVYLTSVSLNTGWVDGEGERGIVVCVCVCVEGMGAVLTDFSLHLLCIWAKVAIQRIYQPFVQIPLYVQKNKKKSKDLS